MISIDKWSGLATNASPYAIPPGAAVTQVNLQVIVPGQITVRPGTAAVSFAATSGTTTATGTTGPIVSIFRYPRTTDNIVYQNSSGQLFVARTPS